MNHHERVAVQRPHTKEFDQESRDRLGLAFTRARERAGYNRAEFVQVSRVGRTSLFKLETGVPVSAETYEKAARALPGWTVDTPREILDGGPAPTLPSAVGDAPRPKLDIPSPVPGSYVASAIRPQVGSDDWLKHYARALDEVDYLDVRMLCDLVRALSERVQTLEHMLTERPVPQRRA